MHIFCSFRLCIFPENHTETDSIIENIEWKFDRTLLMTVLKYIEEKKEVGATYADIEVHVLF